jgi:hypothetical protein
VVGWDEELLSFTGVKLLDVVGGDLVNEVISTQV